MSACLTADEVRAVVEGRTPDEGFERLDQHLLSCEACRLKVRQAYEVAPGDVTVDSTELSAATGPVVEAKEDRYQLQRTAAGAVEVLGRGGFGKVLLARDATLGRDVAMKRLTSQRLHTSRDTSEARLMREARVMAQLEHPAIIPLHELGRGADGQLYYTMRRIRGRTLADAVAEAPSLEARLRLVPHVLTACHAVAYAHSRGVVHRDLKPHNVMLDRFGATYLIDWGLARARTLDATAAEASPLDSGALRMVQADKTLGDARTRLGTLAYMSPEQLDGPRSGVDELSDVWGLGAMLYQVLTGAPPRERAIAENRAHPRPVRERNPEVPKDLAALCDKAMAQRREDRYASAEALAADLDSWLHGGRVTAHDYRPGELLRRFVKANRKLVAVAAVALLAVVAMGASSFWRVRTQRNEARAFVYRLLDQVLDRLAASGEVDVIRRVTSDVDAWLASQGQDDDPGSVAWSWFLLARDADRRDAAEPAWVRRCLDSAAGVDDARARAAALACEVYVVSPQGDESEPWRREKAQALLGQVPTDGTQETVFWVEVRHVLLARLSMMANVSADIRGEIEVLEQQLKLDRQRLQLGHNRVSVLVDTANSLNRRALAASSEGDEAGALRFGQESVALARQAVAARPDRGSLGVLAFGLAQQVSLIRWHVHDAAQAAAARAAMVEETRATYAALEVLHPGDLTTRGEHANFLMELGDAEGAWDKLKDADFSTLSGFTSEPWVFAALTSGRHDVVVAQRSLLLDQAVVDFPLVLGLAHASRGENREAAEALDKALAVTLASAWPSVVMDRWAETLTGPSSEPVKRFVKTFDGTFLTNDEAGGRAAIATLRDELKALATQ